MDPQVKDLWKKIVIMGIIGTVAGICTYILTSSVFGSVFCGIATLILCVYLYGIISSIKEKNLEINSSATVVECEYLEKYDPYAKVTAKYYNVKFLICNNGCNVYCDYLSDKFIEPGITMYVHYNESENTVLLGRNSKKVPGALFAALLSYGIAAMILYVDKHPEALENDSMFAKISMLVAGSGIIAVSIYQLFRIFKYNKKIKTSEKVDAVIISTISNITSNTDNYSIFPQYEYYYNGKKYMYTSQTPITSKMKVGFQTFLYIDPDGIVYEPNEKHTNILSFFIAFPIGVFMVSYIIYTFIH